MHAVTLIAGLRSSDPGPALQAALADPELAMVAACDPNSSKDVLLALVSDASKELLAVLVAHPGTDADVLDALSKRLKPSTRLTAAFKDKVALVQALGTSPRQAMSAPASPAATLAGLEDYMGYPGSNYEGRARLGAGPGLLDSLPADVLAANLVALAASNLGPELIKFLKGTHLSEHLSPLARIGVPLATAARSRLGVGQVDELVQVWTNAIVEFCAWQVADAESTVWLRLGILDADSPARQCLEALGSLPVDFGERLSNVLVAASLNSPVPALSALCSGYPSGEVPADEFGYLALLLAYSHPDLPAASVEKAARLLLGFESVGWVANSDDPQVSAALNRQQPSAHNREADQLLRALAADSSARTLVDLLAEPAYNVHPAVRFRLLGSAAVSCWPEFCSHLADVSPETASDLAQGMDWASLPWSKQQVTEALCALTQAGFTSTDTAGWVFGSLPVEVLSQVGLATVRQLDRLWSSRNRAWPPEAANMSVVADLLAASIVDAVSLDVLESMVASSSTSVAAATVVTSDVLAPLRSARTRPVKKPTRASTRSR